MLGDPNLTVRLLATNYVARTARDESFLVPLRHAVEQSKDPVRGSTGSGRCTGLAACGRRC